jgi:SAM-dependent methyltransferase
VAQELGTRLTSDARGRSVLDIGSNDGTQLKHFQKLGYDVLGVESSKTAARIANDAGVPTLNAFFNLETARAVGRKFDAINASGVFFHLEELHSVTDGIRESLKPQGVFVVQFLYMRRIVENMAFDQIYHEHLLYYNLRTLETLLARHGLTIFDAYLSPIHGGSVIAFVTHESTAPKPTARLEEMRAAEDRDGSNLLGTYLRFASRIVQFRQENLSYLRSAKATGKRVWGFGAPVKGNTMLNYFGVGTDLIECLVERNTLRRGLFAPGSHIPILIEDELTSLPDIYYVLAWNFREEILWRNKALIERGIEFFFPVNPPGPTS